MVEKRKVKTTYAAPSLRHYRERAGLSQVQLSKIAGVGRQTILRLENDGAANGLTLTKLSVALGIDRDELESAQKAPTVVTSERT